MYINDRGYVSVDIHINTHKNHIGIHALLGSPTQRAWKPIVLPVKGKLVPKQPCVFRVVQGSALLPSTLRHQHINFGPGWWVGGLVGWGVGGVGVMTFTTTFPILD